MFVKNVLFLYLAFFQTVFSSENTDSQYDVSTTQESSQPHKKSILANLTIGFDNLVAPKLQKLENLLKHPIEKLREEIVVLKNHHLTTPKNLNEDIQAELQKIEQKQEEQLTILKQHTNQFAAFKNSFESQIQNLSKKVLMSYRDGETGPKNIEPPKNCKDAEESGVYTIWPIDAPKRFDVWCDMETDGGGWIYVINRFDGSQDFNLSWSDYRNGFGDLRGEFWLGLENLYLLTKGRPNELLIELVDQNSTKAHAHYEQFSVGDEDEGYPIEVVRGYSGDAGDDFGLHSGLKFSTPDRDQDAGSGNCAQEFGGGFWYRYCYYCLFTGTYNSTYRGIQSRSFRGYSERLKEVRMMIRPEEH